VGAVFYGVLGCVASSEAWGQQLDGAAIAARRDLIAQAQQARSASQHQQALQLAMRAGRLQMTPSLRRFIAEEQNALGQLAEALGSADLCLREAERDAGATNRDEHISACSSLAEDLRRRVGRVVIEAPSPAPSGLQITVAHAALPDALWGVPYVVTPGLVAIDATVPGRPTFHRDVQIDAANTVNVPISFEGVVAPAGTGTAVVPAGAAEAQQPAEGQQARQEAPQDQTTRTSGPGVGPWITVGAGAVVLGLSGVFFALRGASLADANRGCDASGCPESNFPAYQRAITYNVLTGVSFGVGLAAVAGGVLWYVLARPRGNPPPRTAFGLVPSRDGVTLGLSGSL
jgi:hypothetical protein